MTSDETLNDLVQNGTLSALVQNATLAADQVAIQFVKGSEADRTRAIVRRALECLIGNGMIEVKPRDEWSEWVVLDPPYELPKGTP